MKGNPTRKKMRLSENDCMVIAIPVCQLESVEVEKMGEKKRQLCCENVPEGERGNPKDRKRQKMMTEFLFMSEEQLLKDGDKLVLRPQHTRIDDEGDRLEPEYVMVVMTEIHRAVIRQAQGV